MKNKKDTRTLVYQWKKFVRSGFRYPYFTIAIYEHLYQDTNRFIAHFNREGFFTARFHDHAALQATISIMWKVAEKNKITRKLLLSLEPTEFAVACAKVAVETVNRYEHQKAILDTHIRQIKERYNPNLFGEE